jgi:hypothetical protein
MRIERCTYRPWFAVGSRTAGNNEKSQQSCSRGEEQQQRTPSQQHYSGRSAAFLITAAPMDMDVDVDVDRKRQQLVGNKTH